MEDIAEPLVKNLKTFVAFARKRVGDPHLAEDLVQDSLLKAMKAEQKPGSDEDVITWFYRILRHSIIDLYRKSDARKRGLERLKAELPETPSAEVERTICNCVQRLMPELPEQYQELLKRVDLKGEPLKEAAEALNITVNNLTVRLHRARKQMRDRLEQVCKVCSKHGCMNCTCEE